MITAGRFEYDHPTLESLFGVNVEVDDEHGVFGKSNLQSGHSSSQQEALPLPRDLFGITQSVQDGDLAKTAGSEVRGSRTQVAE